MCFLWGMDVSQEGKNALFPLSKPVVVETILYISLSSELE